MTTPPAPSLTAAHSTQPNIIVFLTDDLAYWVLSPYGNRDARTPSVEHLARTGTRFDRAFTPSPVCSPARACFWTGLFPSGHGVHDWISEAPGTDQRPGIGNLDTLGTRLSAAGYQTALCGKWHVSPPEVPLAGYDVWFTHANGTNARFGPQPFYEGTQRVEHHGHQAGFIGDRAVRFLRERDASRPFFLYVGLTDPHTPHTGQASRLVEPHAEARFEDIPDEPFFDVHGRRRWNPPADPVERRRQLAQYHAAAASVDEQLGRVLDELDNQNLANSTLVVFTSDHGHCNGHHGIATKGNGTVPVNFVDEAIRIPLILRWPGVSPSGSAITAPVDHCDLAATLLDAAGAMPFERQVGGSLAQLLKAPTETRWRQAQICEYGNARMIRTEAWKLIRRFPGPNGRQADELYDLDKDPRETTNRLGDPSTVGIVAELDRRLAEFFAQHESATCSGLQMENLVRSNDQSPWNL